MSIFYSDGACKPNPGKGGWSWVLIENNSIQLIKCGFEKETTNNRMEYISIINAMEFAFKKELEDTIFYTDSQLLVDTYNLWMENWEKRNWKKKGKDPIIKNLDLVKKLYEIKKNKNFNIKWIQGHNGTYGNEVADYFANYACLNECNKTF